MIVKTACVTTLGGDNDYSSIRSWTVSQKRTTYNSMHFLLEGLDYNHMHSETQVYFFF